MMVRRENMLMENYQYHERLLHQYNYSEHYFHKLKIHNSLEETRSTQSGAYIEKDSGQNKCFHLFDFIALVEPALLVRTIESPTNL